VVVYFYPKDDTPGCTAEACSFRDNYEEFKDNGCEVIGISSDTVETHLSFSKKHSLSFHLLADVDRIVRTSFKVPGNMFGLIPGRVTYVINKEGKIVHIFNSQLKSEKHISESLKVLKELG
jgi:thioredoxin-dependent peroxiredoxin